MPFFYGWWIVVARASIVLFGGGTFFYSFGALVDPVEDEFGGKRALIVAGFSVRTRMGGMFAPVAGHGDHAEQTVASHDGSGQHERVEVSTPRFGRPLEGRTALGVGLV